MKTDPRDPRNSYPVLWCRWVWDQPRAPNTLKEGITMKQHTASPTGKGNAAPIISGFGSLNFSISWRQYDVSDPSVVFLEAENSFEDDSLLAPAPTTFQFSKIVP